MKLNKKKEKNYKKNKFLANVIDSFPVPGFK